MTPYSHGQQLRDFPQDLPCLTNDCNAFFHANSRATITPLYLKYGGSTYYGLNTCKLASLFTLTCCCCENPWMGSNLYIPTDPVSMWGKLSGMMGGRVYMAVILCHKKPQEPLETEKAVVTRVRKKRKVVYFGHRRKTRDECK